MILLTCASEIPRAVCERYTIYFGTLSSLALDPKQELITSKQTKNTRVTEHIQTQELRNKYRRKRYGTNNLSNDARLWCEQARPALRSEVPNRVT